MDIYIPHICPYFECSDNGFCIYHDHDDEVCIDCINDVIKALRGYLKELKNAKNH